MNRNVDTYQMKSNQSNFLKTQHI